MSKKPNFFVAWIAQLVVDMGTAAEVGRRQSKFPSQVAVEK
jgi:hypothetical protein